MENIELNNVTNTTVVPEVPNVTNTNLPSQTAAVNTGFAMMGIAGGVGLLIGAGVTYGIMKHNTPENQKKRADRKAAREEKKKERQLAKAKKKVGKSEVPAEVDPNTVKTEAVPDI